MNCSDKELNSFVIYDYERNLKKDILFYICENEEFEISKEKLFDHLWVADNVTGNASGSYTFSRFRASLNLVGNYELIAEMIDEGFLEINNPLKDLEPERLDVCIRCYLLGKCLDEVLTSEDFKKAFKEYKKRGKRT